MLPLANGAPSSSTEDIPSRNAVFEPNRIRFSYCINREVLSHEEIS